jgi:predicted transposase/invertase (TIGR01784 family)
VRIVAQKSICGIDTDRHGIRMDAYIEDISTADVDGMDMIDAAVSPDIYDVEPNSTYEKDTLPKRVRYYHGLIDTKLLARNVKYDKLQNVVIIVILPYDPFDRNRMVYTIKNQCVEDSSIPYDDGAKKIFLYTKGKEGNPSQELRDMLKYIEKSTDENVTNQNLATIQQLVKDVKSRKEVGITYMKSWELEEMHREEGRREGIKEGIDAANANTVRNLLKRNASDTDIMEIVGCDLTFIDKVRIEESRTASF